MQNINNWRIGSGKTNALLNLINHKVSKYSYESADLKHLNNSKASIEYSNDMNDIFKHFEEYKPNKNPKC